MRTLNKFDVVCAARADETKWIIVALAKSVVAAAERWYLCLQSFPFLLAIWNLQTYQQNKY